jgi:hypothetical protein
MQKRLNAESVGCSNKEYYNRSNAQRSIVKCRKRPNIKSSNRTTLPN